MLHNIMAIAFAAKTPSYAKIMELDKRVRDFPDPPPFPGESENVPRTMQNLLATLYKETSLCNIFVSLDCV